nr:hypothetical protein CFP56_38829 [Quercus suber]
MADESDSDAISAMRPKEEVDDDSLIPQLSSPALGSEAGHEVGNITIAEPTRPRLPKRNTLRGESSKSVSEALRLARAREEQETLLGEDEEADDDGCYPPRQDDHGRMHNPHKMLPVYTTIHKIRRLILATIGRLGEVLTVWKSWLM